MIDFIHTYGAIKNHYDYLKHSELDFVEGIVHNSGKPIRYFWCKNDSMMYKVGYYQNWLDITGSITKYWRETNISDLTYSDLCSAIHSLSETLMVNPKELYIRSFEFGVNIPPVTNHSALELSEFALNYKRKLFDDMDNNSKRPSIGKKCKSQQYILKLYSKSMEYNLPFELLRFEIQIKRMAFIKKAGIESLFDLTNKDKLKSLKSMLVATANKIVFYDDSISPEALDVREGTMLLNWKSKIYLKKKLKEQSKDFQKEKRLVINLIDKHGQQFIKQKLVSSISDKWDKLLEN